MRPALYGVLEETRDATAGLRADGLTLDPDVDGKLARFEAAVAHALSSSPDGHNVAHPEEMVVLDALCDLHVSLRDADAHLREQLRPIIETWISYAITTGMSPDDLERGCDDSAVDAWLDAGDRTTN